MLDIISKKIRKYRYDNNLSLRKFASMANLSHIAIYRLENKEYSPSIKTISKIAKAMNIEPIKLLQDNK